MKGDHRKMDKVREYFYEYGIECCICITCTALGYIAGKKSNKKEDR